MQNSEPAPTEPCGDGSNIQNSPAGSSYSQILRSSSITGGAEGLNYLMGMVRIKLIAVLLGPSGVGMVGLYQSAIGLVGALTSLGIGGSGVRDVAEAHASGNPARLAATVKTLRRVCWFTGILGWLAAAALAWPLSVWVFGSGEQAAAIAILGATLLLASIGGGYGAVLQGTRRIGDLARAGVLGMFGATVVAVCLYAWLGKRGIIPVFLTTAAVNLFIVLFFVQRVKLVPVAQSLRETLHHANRLVALGLALMWGGLLAAGLTLGIRSIIVRELGLDANGIYQSAWGISGMFAGFILSAMGMDFYPRLTALANDNEAMNRLVNEQTEIGILLALPGLLGTLAFAPELMRIFYTTKFLSGAELLPWFVLGILGRVVSWPLGYVQLAKGASRWFAGTETFFVVLQFCLVMLLLSWIGLPGVAIAFAISYGLYVVGMLGVTHHLTRFRWSTSTLKIIAVAAAFVTAGFVAQYMLTDWAGLVVGGGLAAGSTGYSLRGMAKRLGPSHPLVRWGLRMPGGPWLCGVC